MLRIAVLCLGLASLTAQATDRWAFEAKTAVTGSPVSGVYPHLDGAGRKHVAVAENSVAAVWEDNRSRTPQVYVALKANDREQFSKAMQVSDGSEAYEPAIVSLPKNRFVLAWEQDGAVHARVMNEDGPGAPVKLGSSTSSHVSLASFGERVFAAWREQQDRRWFVKVAALRVPGARKLSVESVTPVEAAGLETRVLFPSIAVNEAGLSVAWEDRRAGHTRLLISHSPDQARSFGDPQHLNEFLSNRNQYDQGNGVTRVALASFAQDEILAAWMDKRRGGLGYGIFAALGSDGGAIFGPNEKVHGEEGDQQPHYNPAVAGNPNGDFVVAWDDFRRGDSDIWLSAYNEDEEWSQDFSPPVASGGGEQSHPAIALDNQGRLHLLWMERGDMDSPGRLWYSRGIPR
jgi:hypothetical protein